jgi:hypothetical protein
MAQGMFFFLFSRRYQYLMLSWWSIIDRDIPRLEESIRALKSRKNELTLSLAFLSVQHNFSH